MCGKKISTRVYYIRVKSVMGQRKKKIHNPINKATKVNLNEVRTYPFMNNFLS